MAKFGNIEWVNPHQLHEDDTLEDEKAETFRCEPLNTIQLRSPEVSITQVSVSLRAIYVITSDRQLFRWTVNPYEKLKEPRREDRVELTINHPVPDLRQVFTDRTGFHTLVTFAKSAKQGAHYFHLQSTSSIFLYKLHDVDVTSVAWNFDADESSTREILLGTDRGSIIELVIEYNLQTRDLKNQYFTHLIELPGSPCVDGILYEMVPGVPSKCFVMATTNKLLYQFSGDANDQERPEFPRLFEPYRQNSKLVNESAHDVGGDSARAHLQFYYKRDFRSLRAKSFVWFSGVLMYGKLPKHSRGKLLVSQMKPVLLSQLPNQALEGVAMTAYHVYFLHTHTLQVVSKQSQQVIHSIPFSMSSGEVMLGLQYDPDSHSLIMWSNRYVYQLLVEREERDVWKYFIEQNKYEEAVQFCEKHQLPHLSKVKGVYGDVLFNRKEFVKAADAYAGSDKSFEEVCLKIMHNSTALHQFLELKLARLGPEFKAQRTLLSTWLLELHLHHMNTLFMTSSEKEQENAEETLKTFLALRKPDLDENTTYTLLQSHGRVSEWVYYAEMNGNYKNVMLHYLNQQDAKRALSKLELIDPSSQDEILYKYSPIFIKHEPTKTVDLLMSTILKAKRDNKDFDVQKVLPALMNISKDKRDQAIRFEEFCIYKLEVKDKALHNLYVFHLSERDEARLITYLRSQEKREPDFDMEYALSVCKHNKRIEAQIALYTMMKLYSEAVSLALSHGMLALAKDNAKKPEKVDEELSRKLWIQIAKHLIDEHNFQDALQVMRESNVIKMEDILPMFDKDVKISNFKEEICNALEAYKEKIRDLNEELKQSNESSVEVKLEIEQVKKRKIEIDGQKNCDLCNRSLLKRSFFIFPCSHSFHKDCLCTTLTSVYSKKDRYMHSRLVQLTKAVEERAGNADYKLQLDNLIGGTCYLCGNLYIETIRDYFIDDETELQEWALTR